MSARLQLRIARLTLDAGALEGMTPAQFDAQLRAALARELAGGGAPLPGAARTAADRVAATVAPQVNARLGVPPAPGMPGARA